MYHASKHTEKIYGHLSNTHEMNLGFLKKKVFVENQVKLESLPSPKKLKRNFESCDTFQVWKMQLNTAVLTRKR